MKHFGNLTEENVTLWLLVSVWLFWPCYFGFCSASVLHYVCMYSGSWQSACKAWSQKCLSQRWYFIAVDALRTIRTERLCPEDGVIYHWCDSSVDPDCAVCQTPNKAWSLLLNSYLTVWTSCFLLFTPS